MIKPLVPDADLAPTYGSRTMSEPAPKYRLPQHEMSPRTAYQLIHDELMLDGNARLNLATFVTTWMEPEAALEAARVLGADALHAAHQNVGPALVAAAHGSGIEVCAWTATAQRDLRRLADAGVDTVITDDVVTARAVLGEALP